MVSRPPSTTYNGHQHPGQPPSSTSLGVPPPPSMSPRADSVINIHGHQHPGQPLLSTSLGAQTPLSMCSVISTWGSPHHQCRLGWPPINVAWSSLHHRRSFRAQCAGIGSISLLRRARYPLNRSEVLQHRLGHTCVEVCHNLPWSKVVQHRSFYLATV